MQFGKGTFKNQFWHQCFGSKLFLPELDITVLWSRIILVPTAHPILVPIKCVRKLYKQANQKCQLRSRRCILCCSDPTNIMRYLRNGKKAIYQKRQKDFHWFSVYKKIKIASGLVPD
jgi:hypothetical protein